jgi:hypothetical protein
MNENLLTNIDLLDSVYFLVLSAIIVCLVIYLLRYRNKKLKVNDLRKEFEKLPLALKSPIEIYTQNMPHRVYDGELKISDGDQEVFGTGYLQFLWLPNPRAVLEADIDLKNPHDRLKAPMLHISGYEPVQLIITNTKNVGSQETTHIEGILSRPLWPLEFSIGMKEVWFTLTNFHYYIGSSVRPNANKFSAQTRRWTINSDKYEITIDLAEGYKEIIEGTKKDGGFGRTHFGRIRSAQGESLNRLDIETLNTILFYYFGFARGFWVGPVLPYIERVNERYIVYGPFRITAWQSAGSWFPNNKPNEYGNTFQEFHRLMKDSVWEVGIRHTIDWYVDANTADTLESSIAKAQVALELLAWLILVDRRKVKSSTQYRKDGAATNLGDLLSLFGISTDFPSHLLTLKNITSSWGATNGVDAFVKVRNQIIHSTKKGRGQLSALGTPGKLEAKQLGLQYIELCLLAVMKYKGTYEDRTILNRWKGQDIKVPWA